MNEKLAPIFVRRSIRKYTSEDVPDFMVQDILEAGMAAPSACCTDPWHVLVVKDQDALARIADGLPHGKMLADAGVGFVVCGDLEAAHDGQVSYMLQDCSALIQNMLLAVSMLGLGACWLGVHPREERMVHIRELYGLPESIVPLAVLAVGWPGETKEARTRFEASKVHAGSW